VRKGKPAAACRASAGIEQGAQITLAHHSPPARPEARQLAGGNPVANGAEGYARDGGDFFEEQQIRAHGFRQGPCTIRSDRCAEKCGSLFLRTAPFVSDTTPNAIALQPDGVSWAPREYEVSHIFLADTVAQQRLSLATQGRASFVRA